MEIGVVVTQGVNEMPPTFGALIRGTGDQGRIGSLQRQVAPGVASNLIGQVWVCCGRRLGGEGAVWEAAARVWGSVRQKMGWLSVSDWLCQRCPDR